MNWKRKKKKPINIRIQKLRTIKPSFEIIYLQTRVGIFAGLLTPDMWYQLSLSITFLMLTTPFSTHGFQQFFFPFIQHNATSEFDQQYIETRPFKATNTFFKTLLNKTHPNNSKGWMDNFFKGATLVLAHEKLILIPRAVSTGI